MSVSRSGPVRAIHAIIDRVAEFEAKGSISDGETAESLRALLARAEEAISAGDCEDAVRWLARLIDHIERRTPRHIRGSAARILVEQIVREDWHRSHRALDMYV